MLFCGVLVGCVPAQLLLTWHRRRALAVGVSSSCQQLKTSQDLMLWVWEWVY